MRLLSPVIEIIKEDRNSEAAMMTSPLQATAGEGFRYF